MKPCLTVLAALAPALQAQLVSAQEADQAPRAISHNIAAAAYYSRGDYGQAADTSIYYFPLSYDVSIDRWRFKLTVPHIEISGYGNVLVNVGGVGRDALAPAAEQDARGDVSSSGIGDTIVAASYQFDPLAEGWPFMDITAEVKLATADEKKGLGTVKSDYGVQLDLYQIYGQSTLFSTLGYRKRGRSELFPDMMDSLFASVGISRPMGSRWLEEKLGGKWTYGLIYDYREAASRYSQETHELVPFVSWNPAERWTMMTYVVTGFTQDSADIAVGAQLSYRW